MFCGPKVYKQLASVGTRIHNNFQCYDNERLNGKTPKGFIPIWSYQHIYVILKSLDLLGVYLLTRVSLFFKSKTNKILCIHVLAPHDPWQYNERKHRLFNSWCNNNKTRVLNVCKYVQDYRLKSITFLVSMSSNIYNWHSYPSQCGEQNNYTSIA